MTAAALNFIETMSGLLSAPTKSAVVQKCDIAKTAQLEAQFRAVLNEEIKSVRPLRAN